MKIFHRLPLAVLSCLPAVSGASERAVPHQSNILGLAGEALAHDLGGYGAKDVRTPHADRLTLVGVLRDEAALAGAHDIEIVDGIAFIAGKGFTARAKPQSGVYPYEPGKGGSLATVDITRPATPKLLWFTRDPLGYEDAETLLPLTRGRLLVGTRDLFLFDVANPAVPKQLSAIQDRPRVDMINGFARRGDVVFGANKQGFVCAVDVAKSDQISLLGSRNVQALDGLEKPHDAALCGDFLVIAAGEGFGISGRPGRVGVYRIFDARSKRVLPPEEWIVVGRLEHSLLAGANRVRTRGNFAYTASSLSPAADRTGTLRPNVSVIDLTDPATPRLRGTIDFPSAAGPNGLEIAGDLVFAAGGQTVQAIDVSDPDHPRELARFTSASAFPAGLDDGHDLVLHDDHLFVTAQNSHALVVLQVEGERIRKAMGAR